MALGARRWQGQWGGAIERGMKRGPWRANGAGAALQKAQPIAPA